MKLGTNWEKKLVVNEKIFLTSFMNDEKKLFVNLLEKIWPKKTFFRESFINSVMFDVVKTHTQIKARKIQLFSSFELT